MCTVNPALACAVVLAAWPAFAQVPPATGLEEYSLATVKRICVETLSGDAALLGPAKEIAIASLFVSKRFLVTEKCSKADAILKGAVLEHSDSKVRAEGEGMNFGVAGGGAHATPRHASGGFGAALGGNDESLMSAETKTTASVTLRLVNQEGDVLWAYTQDSAGGKSKTALADAVDRAIRNLLKFAERPAPTVPGPR